jgi:prevent-host-death family protein
MKTITMVGLRTNAEGILRRVAKGERFILSHRGRPAARIEPISQPAATVNENDPFLTISRRAKPSPQGKTRHDQIDHLLYGSS